MKITLKEPGNNIITNMKDYNKFTEISIKSLTKISQYL